MLEKEIKNTSFIYNYPPAFSDDAYIIAE